ncbi:MAG TPA: helix-turn-helix domain-containing protein [Pseudolabrys sp.]
MTILQGARREGHAREVPQPAFSNGPWGEAIRYWLKERKWLQADLAKETGIRANTISRVSRGFHTTTSILERIAKAFNVPLDDVLLSPDRKLTNDHRRRLAVDIAEDVLRRMETRKAAAPLNEVLHDAVTSTDRYARRLQTAALTKKRKEALSKKNRRRSS